MGEPGIGPVIRRLAKLVPGSLRRRLSGIPWFSPLQRWILEQSLGSREFIHTVDSGPASGLVFPVVLPDDKGAWLGHYEYEFLSEIARAIQPGMTCFDVGAWHGYVGGMMALRSGAVTVLFEPLPENRVRIERLMALNPALDIRLAPYALGDRSGVAAFHRMPESSMGKLGESRFQPGAQPTETLEVEVRTVDSLLDEGVLPQPDLIKIDVEGAELAVLDGARQLLEVGRVRVFVEAHSEGLLEEVRHRLTAANYRMRLIERRDLSRRDGRQNPVFHLAAVPASGV